MSIQRLKWRRATHPLLPSKDPTWVRARAVPSLGWWQIRVLQLPSAGGGHRHPCGEHTARQGAPQRLPPKLCHQHQIFWVLCGAAPRVSRAPQIHPAAAQQTQRAPANPKGAGISQDRSSGDNGPPTCSCSAGHCKSPCRETLCWWTISNLSSSHYSHMWGLFSKALILWPNAAPMDDCSKSGFYRAVEELHKDCAFLGALVLRANSDPRFCCCQVRVKPSLLGGLLFFKSEI